MNEYKNLSTSELEMADHYCETGNRAGLRHMQEVSKNRETDSRATWHHSNRERQNR